jgi:hypothetical protein
VSLWDPNHEWRSGRVPVINGDRVSFTFNWARTLTTRQLDQLWLWYILVAESKGCHLSMEEGRQNYPPVSWKLRPPYAAMQPSRSYYTIYGNLHDIRHLVLRPKDKTGISKSVSLPPWTPVTSWVIQRQRVNGDIRSKHTTFVWMLVAHGSQQIKPKTPVVCLLFLCSFSLYILRVHFADLPKWVAW